MALVRLCVCRSLSLTKSVVYATFVNDLNMLNDTPWEAVTIQPAKQRRQSQAGPRP